ncbi:MAG: VanW family protein [Firmicutes bacterium]|nr:VanW family protein [Bacillota bacterium]
MKRIFVATLALFIIIPLFGFSEPQQVLFSIYYEENVIIVTNKTIKSNWWDTASRESFVKGRSLYQRANELQAMWEGRTNEAIHETFQTSFPELWPIVKKVGASVNKPINNGKVNFNPDSEEKFWVTEQSHGRELDIERLCAEIIGTLGRREPRQIVAIVRDTQPIDPNVILERITVRSQYSTTFIDNAPRENNITLALEVFDGLVVNANETISFNDIVGKRTRDRGYATAKIILDGEFVDGVGGGVCQASTTLFNAVLLSGLRIIESHNHSLPINYVPLGLDAMVSSQADLEFKNTTGEAIYIEARVIDHGRRNQAVVRIYGAPRTHEYKPRVERTIHTQSVEVQGGIIQDGEEIVLDYGYPPRSARTYIDIYKNGELVDSRFIRKSHYKGKPRIVKYEQPELLPLPDDGL